MPELPEVETVRADLASHVIGQTILSMDIDLPRLLKNGAPSDFAASMVGKTITAVTRKGKYLTLHLSGAADVLVHLRMTGSLVYEAGLHRPIRGEHIVWQLSSGWLLYGDIRTFGCLWLIPQTGTTGIKGFDTLGPDGISPAFTTAYLGEKIRSSTRPIKTLLLDQTVVAGLGNIYVDEALFVARIRPSRRCNRISKREAAALHDAIVAVLQNGLAHGGTTIRDFINGSGREGENQHFLRVYGKEGTPCPRCGTVITYTKLGGRGTHYCRHCQK